MRWGNEVGDRLWQPGLEVNCLLGPVLPFDVGKQVPAPGGASEGPVLLSALFRMFQSPLGYLGWTGLG